MIDLAKQDFMAVELALYGANSLDRDVRIISNNNIVASVRDVVVIDKITPIKEEISGGTRVNA